MSNLLPTGFPLFGSPVSASFDFNDVSSGNSYVQYRLFTAGLSGATTFNLGTTDVYSFDISTTDTGADAEINFDTAPFNLPRTVNGTAYFSCGFGVVTAGAGNVQVILHKVDSAGTETALSASLSGAQIGPGAATSVGMWLVPMPLTQTLIKSGEKLRLGVTVTGNGADLHEIGHDPLGRDGVIISGATVTTKSNLYVPFKVDVGQ